MIATEYQAQIHREWIERFQAALDKCEPGTTSHKVYAEQIKDLQAEVTAYEEGMKNGDGWLIPADAGRRNSRGGAGVGDAPQDFPGKGPNEGDEPGEG